MKKYKFKKDEVFFPDDVAEWFNNQIKEGYIWGVHDIVERTGEFFNIGQVYKVDTAEQIKCRKCGGKEFNVASAGYFTAIRCKSCKWEWCIHEG